MLVDSKQLEEVAREFTNRSGGRLTVATTHLHARYPLLPVITAFSKKYANVQLSLLQCPPAEIAARVAAGEADIGISTGPDEFSSQCVTLKAYKLHRCVIAPRGHAILKRKRPALADIARYPLIVYDASFSSGWIVLRDAFEKAGIKPNVVLSAIDADVIKAYVAGKLGIAVLQSLAYDPDKDPEIGAVGGDHLFPVSDTKLILNRGKYLRQYMFDFIAMVAPAWTPAKVRAALVAPITERPNRAPAGELVPGSAVTPPSRAQSLPQATHACHPGRHRPCQFELPFTYFAVWTMALIMGRLCTTRFTIG